MRIYLYGSGNRCKILLKLIKNTDITVAGIVDSDSKKWGSYIEDKLIFSPSQLKNYDNEYVCITFFGENDYEPIWEEISDKYNIANDKLLSFHDVLKIAYLKIDISSIKLTNESHINRILFDGSWPFDMGGVEAWIKDTVIELSKERDDIFLVTKMNQILDGEINNKSIIDFCIDNSCSFEQESVMSAIKLLMSYMPCTIISSRADEILLAAYILWHRFPNKIKIICVVHGACDGLIRDLFAYDKAICKYFCVTSASENALLSMGVNMHRIGFLKTFIRRNICIEKEYTLERELPIRIGYAGRLEVFHKRADLLLKLIEELEQNGLNYYFEIAGTGSFESELIEFLSDSKYDKVKFIGSIDRDKIFDFWKDKDIAINVSDSEGRPISNIEAMFCGAVPVVTGTAGILEDVKNEITGYTVDIGDIVGMGNVLKYLEKNRIILKNIGLNAQNYIREKTNVQEYISMWNETLDA